MKSGTIILFLSMLLSVSGCGLMADQRYEDTLTKMKGRPVEDVVALIGPPTRESRAYYIWEYEEEVYHPGGWRSVPQTVNIYNRDGKVVGTRTYYEQVYDPPYTERRNCNTTVYLDAYRRVKDFVFKGNYCGYWFEETSGQ